MSEARFCNGTDYQRVGCHALNGDRCMGTFQCGDAQTDGDVMQGYNERKALLAENAALRQQVAERDAELATLREAVEHALNLLAEAGNGRQYDPSWIRPKSLTREQVADRAIQAYHVLHLEVMPQPHAKAAHERWRKMETALQELCEVLETTHIVGLRKGKTLLAAKWEQAKAALREEGKV